MKNKTSIHQKMQSTLTFKDHPMKTEMVWVKVSELIEKNREFEIIAKTEDGNKLWCLIRNGVPVMYQEELPNTQPFCNVFFLVETHKKNSNVLQIMAVTSGANFSGEVTHNSLI